MTEKSIKFRDPVVERVVDKFISRSDIGFKKYGVTLEQDQSRIFEWLNHLQEELMDAVLYLQKAKEVYSEDLMDAVIRRIEKNEED
jgi:hypothetical protein